MTSTPSSGVVSFERPNSPVRLPWSLTVGVRACIAGYRGLSTAEVLIGIGTIGGIRVGRSVLAAVLVVVTVVVTVELEHLLLDLDHIVVRFVLAEHVPSPFGQRSPFLGLDLSAFRMLEIKDGDWTLVPAGS